MRTKMKKLTQLDPIYWELKDIYWELKEARNAAYAGEYTPTEAGDKFEELMKKVKELM
jgi:hypothetical protein